MVVCLLDMSFLFSKQSICILLIYIVIDMSFLVSNQSVCIYIVNSLATFQYQNHGIIVLTVPDTL